MIKQESFIKEYNGLLDQIAKDNLEPLLWATDFASKNRFSSLLPDVMETLASDGQKFRRFWLGDLLFRLKKMAGIFYHALCIANRMCIARRYALPAPLGKAYIVVKTFIYDHSFDTEGQYKDVFFTRLLEHLRQKNDVLVCAHILGNFKSCLRKAKTCGISVVPLEAVLSFKDLWQATFEALCGHIHVRSPVMFCGQDVSALVKNEFWRSNNGVQMWQYVHLWAIGNLSRRYSIKSFIMTWENYPWERMAVLALRKSSPSTKIIGYQHTVVPQAYLNYFMSHSEQQAKVLPDRFLTVGQHPADIIKEYSSLEVDVQPACALRFEYLASSQAVSPKPARIRNVLIPLEGFYHVYPMVAHILKQLGLSNQYHLRIRTHPLLPWAKFEQRYHPNVCQYPNVEISSQSALKEDLLWADVVLYWSSTVSIEALMMGKPLIHIHRSPILSYDPLFNCPHFKQIITMQQDITVALAHFESMFPTQWLDEQFKAKSYIADYFHPVSEATLNKFIF